MPCRLRAGLPPYAPAFASWIHCWRYLSAQVREQGTCWALGSLCSFPKFPAFPKSACAASLLCSAPRAFSPRIAHSRVCAPLQLSPLGEMPNSSTHRAGTSLCPAEQPRMPRPCSPALKQLQFPGQVSGCPDRGLSSSGPAVPWLQPPVPQGAHPGCLLPRGLTPRQGELINLDSSRNPKLVSISVYFYFLIQSPWCQN